jgi:hypothetical protein
VIRVLQTLALPLGHVAGLQKNSGWSQMAFHLGKSSAISHLPIIRAGNGTRTRDLLLGKEVFYQLNYARRKQRVCAAIPTCFMRKPQEAENAESQNRTGDTAIFSRVLYQLSYLGPMNC